MSIPRKLWLLWLQGWDTAPWIVRTCLASWQKYNSSWDIHLLSADSLPQFVDVSAVIPDYERKTITTAGLSDIVRVALLETYGGVWADASVFCCTPLDDWIADYVVDGFFAFRTRDPVHDTFRRPLNSWFLAGAPESYVLTEYVRAVSAFWQSKDSTDDYFWFHHLFNDLLTHDPRIRRVWNAIPDTIPRSPLNLLNYLFDDIRNHADARASFLARERPVYKLSWKHDFSTIGPSSVLQFLLDVHGCRA